MLRLDQRPGAQPRPQRPQPAQAELGLQAELAAHQLVSFIQHHRLQRAEQLQRLGVGQHQAEDSGW